MAIIILLCVALRNMKSKNDGGLKSRMDIDGIRYNLYTAFELKKRAQLFAKGLRKESGLSVRVIKGTDMYGVYLKQARQPYYRLN
jgi:hypothetical protein